MVKHTAICLDVSAVKASSLIFIKWVILFWYSLNRKTDYIVFLPKCFYSTTVLQCSLPTNVSESNSGSQPNFSSTTTEYTVKIHFPTVPQTILLMHKSTFEQVQRMLSGCHKGIKFFWFNDH